MKVALDTNIIVYAEGIDDPKRQSIANVVLSRIPREFLVVSVQVLGELFNVLVRRRVPRGRARERAAYWRDSLAVHETSPELMEDALNFAAEHKVRIWDAVILAAAAQYRCDLLLSEDFQDGFTWRGVTVANPFAAAPHRLLMRLLDGG
jgi:predicted nucleic acid-binding protein